MSGPLVHSVAGIRVQLALLRACTVTRDSEHAIWGMRGNLLCVGVVICFGACRFLLLMPGHQKRLNDYACLSSLVPLLFGIPNLQRESDSLRPKVGNAHPRMCAWHYRVRRYGYCVCCCGYCHACTRPCSLQRLVDSPQAKGSSESVTAFSALTLIRLTPDFRAEASRTHAGLPAGSLGLRPACAQRIRRAGRSRVRGNEKGEVSPQTRLSRSRRQSKTHQPQLAVERLGALLGICNTLASGIRY